jgi:hypothetical protein
MRTFFDILTGAARLLTHAVATTADRIIRLRRVLLVPAGFLLAAFILGIFAERQSFLGQAVIGLAILGGVGLIPTATGWHRILIQSDASRGSGRAYGFDRRELLYVRNALFIWVAVLIPFEIIDFAFEFLVDRYLEEPDYVQYFIVLPSWVDLTHDSLRLVVLTAVVARFGLALPAAALGDNPGFRDITSFVKGRFLPLAIAVALTVAASQRLDYLIVVEMIALPEHRATDIAIFLVRHLTMAFLVLVALALLSRAYGLAIAAAPPKTDEAAP